MNKGRLFKPLILLSSLALIGGAHAEQIMVDKAEWEAMKAAVEALTRQQTETQQTAEQAAQVAEEAQETAEASIEAVEEKSGLGNWSEKTKIGGYAEVLYNGGTQRSDNSDDLSNEADVQRFIFYIGHEFNETLRFFSETELEHSRAGRGDDDPGALELEQAYIEWDYSQDHSVLAGLLLPPLGILNETHEPETFYGVERTRTETRIIPTTYRVIGVKGKGIWGHGISYDLALHEGLQFDDGDLDIRDARQSGARANAEKLAGTARVKYTGMPGLEVALGFQYQPDFTQEETSNSNLRRLSIDSDGPISGLLSTAHVIWQYNSFGLRALYARWDIDSDVEDLADSSGTLGTGRDEMEGWYIEPSFKFNDNVGVFARYESVDERAGSNTGDAEDSETRRTLVGLNYWLHPQVVLKADVQFENDEGDGDDLDGFNLGAGWSF